MTTQARTLNVGVVGLGLAGSGVVPAVQAMPIANLIAAADVNERALASFREKTGAKTYGSIEELCKDPEIDTVWIATPNELHCPHTVLAANMGKNIVIEKPMAINLAEAEQMIDACDRNGVQLICGGSRSSSALVRKMREIVKAGELGRLRAMATWAATAWMLQPRRPDEYDVKRGGGVGYRQSPHQVDSCRLIAGGIVRSVRGVTGAWMPPRNTAPGYFSAILEFDNDAFATLIYDAYGYFQASEFFDSTRAGPDAPGLQDRIEARRQIVSGTRDEAAAKEQRTMGTQRQRESAAAPAGGGQQRRGGGYTGDLGLLVVSCEHGEMRQSPNGMYVYRDDRTDEIELVETRGGHSPELDELYQALVNGREVLHGGRWGLATLEVSLAIMESAQEHRDIEMKYQVPVPSWA